MAAYDNLRAVIAANVYQNNNNEVTADMVKAAMNAMVASLGAEFQFGGVAEPTDNPGTPDYKVAYLAATPGTYTNFGGITLADGEVAILKWNGSWSKETTGIATAAVVSSVDLIARAAVNRAKIEVNKILDSSTWLIVNSATADVGIVKILGGGKISLTGAVPYRVTFFSSETIGPGTKLTSYVGVTMPSPCILDIPATASVAVINFQHADNPNGYADLFVEQDNSAVLNSTYEKLLPPVVKETNHCASSSTWEYVTSDSFDAALVPILPDSKWLAVKNSTVARVVFYNSFTPNSTTYISNVRNVQECAIPTGAVYAIINFTHEDNPDGISDAQIQQSWQAARLADIPPKRELKVLSFGSSFGVNTIIQFPYFAKAAGVAITCGNLYLSSATFANIVDIINGLDNWAKGSIFHPESTGWEAATTDFAEMLKAEEWDVIIINRSASQRKMWTAQMATDLQTIIEYIRANVKGAPRIVFNPTFAYPAYTTDKTAQIAETELINTTAGQMQDQFGFEIIPIATALQNARMTNLIGFGSVAETIPDLAEDGLHLDTGVGSYVASGALFEWLCGPLGVSIIANQYAPVLADITSMGVFAAGTFTAPTAANINVAKYCVLAACRKPDEVNTAIGARYPYQQ